MSESFKIYMTTKALSEIFKDEVSLKTEEQSTWYRILLKQSEIRLTGFKIPEGLVDENDKSDSANAYRFSLALGCTITLADEFIETVKEDHSKVLEHPNSAYFIDIDGNEAEEIQNNYGVICQSASAKPDTKVFDKSLSFDFKKNAISEHRWNDVFDSISHVPNNSICLIDRNLFAYDGYGLHHEFTSPRTNGIDNVENIIRACLPKKFSNTYCVYVIFAQNVSNGFSFEEIAEELFKRISQISIDVKYPILAQLVAFRQGHRNPDLQPAKYNDDITHERQIISNYFYIDAGNGLNAIREWAANQDEGNYSQKIQVNLLYPHDSLYNEHADPIERTITRLRNDFSSFIENWKTLPLEDDQYWYVSNEGGFKADDFKNRLFS